MGPTIGQGAERALYVAHTNSTRVQRTSCTVMHLIPQSAQEAQRAPDMCFVSKVPRSSVRFAKFLNF